MHSDRGHAVDPSEPRAAPGGAKHELKLPVFWQDMGVEVGIYIKLPSGEEPVYLAMNCDRDSIETAQRFLGVIKEKL